LWMMSTNEVHLSSFGLSSPRANLTESITLDLPEPLGPVMTVKPRSSEIETFFSKVLKPLSSILLM